MTPKMHCGGPVRKSDSNPVWVFLAAMLAATLGLVGCASTKARNTESLLSAAGFHTLTPSTPKQQSCYAALPPYQVQRRENNGKIVYAYADKKAGLLYVGGEKEYQQFMALAQQQKIANEQLQAAQMNENASMDWDGWGPGGFWW